MGSTIKKTVVYYSMAVAITWIFWISSMIYSIVNNIELPYNEGFYKIFTQGYDSTQQMVAHIIFSIAVYGPLAAMIISKMLLGFKTQTEIIQSINQQKPKTKLKWVVFVFIYPVVLFLLGAFISLITTGFSQGFKIPTLPLWFIPILFSYQCITSGTEEFGWRGYLQPLLQNKFTASKSCYIIGIIWSVWHYPFIIYTNYKGGLFLTIISLIGFTMLTIPQAFIMGWLYNSTRNVILCVLFHAWSNTVSFYIFAASPNPQLTPILVAIATWFIANYLEKKYSKETLCYEENVV